MKSITAKTKRRFFLLLAGTLLISGILWYLRAHTGPPDPFKVKAFEVSGGWGFEILVNDKTFIYQPFIPGLPGKKAFPDRKAALNAGNKMKNRLLQGKIPAKMKQDDMVRSDADSLGNFH